MNACIRRIEIGLPEETKEDLFDNYFHFTNRTGYFLPTNEYLEAFAEDFIKEHLNEDYTVKEVKDIFKCCLCESKDFPNIFEEDEQIKKDTGFITLSDKFSSLYDGESILNPRVISKLFPEVEIEAACIYNEDDFWTYRLYKNGKVSK